jgi:hypothetical protein
MTFVKARETKEKAILIEEKATKKIKHAHNILNEGSLGMFPPSKILPTLGRPIKQANKHKPKRYGK